MVVFRLMECGRGSSQKYGSGLQPLDRNRIRPLGRCPRLVWRGPSALYGGSMIYRRNVLRRLALTLVRIELAYVVIHLKRGTVN